MDNPITIQYFEWYLPADSKHWQRLKDNVQGLVEMGVGGVWLPPCYKGTGVNDVGYGVYDLYDLGEFEQKGTVATKYGTLAELEEAISTLHEHGIAVYGDCVINHKAGADETELFKAVKVDPNNREKQISEPFDIKGWTKFTFPGRGNKYSEFKWNFNHFTATDYDEISKQSAIYRILGENKGFSQSVDDEKGNFDYLMFADIDYDHPDVRQEIKKWGSWYVNKLKLDGLRLDALKHIDETFIDEFVQSVRQNTDKNLYMVGEYWNGDVGKLKEYLAQVNTWLALFDVALHFNFYHASNSGDSYDMRQIFANTLVEDKPLNVMTFVDNHDSQKGQALESYVQEWFKPLAYALILLREDGYPCLFYGDYYGCGGDNPTPALKDKLDPLLKARKQHAYGEQRDYFDDPNCIAFVRLGDDKHEKSGLACILSNGEGKSKYLEMGTLRAGQEWYDLTGNVTDTVMLDEKGGAEFSCAGGSVSIWVEK